MIEYFYMTPIYVTQTGTNTPGQSGPESNGNGGVLHSSQNSRTGVSTADSLAFYPRYTLWAVEDLLLCRDAVGLNLSQHGSDFK